MHPEEIAKKYPWCSIAQISLLQHFKINNSTAFDKQANKTAMVFNNSSWLNWQLHLVSPQTNKVQSHSETLGEINDQDDTEPQKIVEESVEKESEISKPSEVNTEDDKEPDQKFEANNVQESEITGITEINTKLESEPEKILEPNPEDDEANAKIQHSLSQISLHANTTEDSIAFEPLHTVDYFASQGIKITEDPITNDKLGSQVKSFTEWLKSMKKIYKENLPAGDEQTDKAIQKIAEHSNADADVVTEALANVLIDQNKIEKAIAMYEKLSLINPSKSAYFAAQIDRLKNK
ncbi:MAG: hypothetical protein WKF59_22165 [Chitinophagaceae bacterium]